MEYSPVWCWDVFSEVHSSYLVIFWNRMNFLEKLRHFHSFCNLRKLFNWNLWDFKFVEFEGFLGDYFNSVESDRKGIFVLHSTIYNRIKNLLTMFVSGEWKIDEFSLMFHWWVRNSEPVISLFILSETWCFLRKWKVSIIQIKLRWFFSIRFLWVFWLCFSELFNFWERLNGIIILIFGITNNTLYIKWLWWHSIFWLAKPFIIFSHKNFIFFRHSSPLWSSFVHILPNQVCKPFSSPQKVIHSHSFTFVEATEWCEWDFISLDESFSHLVLMIMFEWDFL